MALVLADRVKETTTTAGTGTVTLLGAAPGFQSFAVVGDANTTYYTIAGQTTSEWEVGIGTYTSSGTTLARTTVLSNSAGTQPTALTFSAGTKDVFVTYPSSKSVNLDASGNATALGTPASGVVTNLTGTASININGTVGATTPAAGTFTSISDSGNLTFTGTGNRITGDWSTATTTDRPAFQTSVVNGATSIFALPNGTGVLSQWIASNNSDPTNAGVTRLYVSSTESRLEAGITGTGTYLPMTFYTGGSERVRITTAGGVSFGATGTAYGTSGQVLTSAGNAPPTWTTATSANTASAIVARDASGNFTAGTVTTTNVNMGFTSTATAAGTTTLTASSTHYQRFTGTTTQTIVLPVTSTLAVGITYAIENASTGNLTVNSSGGNLVITVIPGVTVQCMCIGTTLTTAADWDPEYNEFAAVTGSGSVVLATSPQISSLGVGTAASGTAGEIRATNNVTAFYSSDIKFKENVRDIPNALATVNAIGGKLFDWTDTYIESKGGADGYFVQKADFGVIAQDVQKVFPIAVRTREDGSLAVDYEKLGVLAFAALVEITKRVEALEDK